MIRLKRLGTSRYATSDERFLIEHSAVSTGEWDDEDMDWLVFDAEITPELSAAGVPDAVYQGSTLRLCREFIEQRLLREKANA